MGCGHPTKQQVGVSGVTCFPGLDPTTFPSDLRKPRGGSGHPGESVTPLWPAGWSKMFPAAGGTQVREAGAAAPTPAPACQACLCPLAALSPLNESVTPMPSLRMFHQGTRPPQGSQPSIPAKLHDKALPGRPVVTGLAGRAAITTAVQAGATVCPRSPRHRGPRTQTEVLPAEPTFLPDDSLVPLSTNTTDGNCHPSLPAQEQARQPGVPELKKKERWPPSVQVLE